MATGPYVNMPGNKMVRCVTIGSFCFLLARNIPLIRGGAHHHSNNLGTIIRKVTADCRVCFLTSFQDTRKIYRSPSTMLQAEGNMMYPRAFFTVLFVQNTRLQKLTLQAQIARGRQTCLQFTALMFAFTGASHPH